MEIYYFKSVPSTNTTLLEMSKKGAKSWSVCWTSHQTQGRGYADNEWKTVGEKNLAVSVLIKSELNHLELIYFNQWICNVICQFLTRFSDEVFVKWPNDIIIRNKKVCGILIETYKSDSQLNIVFGIGLNVNQIDFSGLPKAGSLSTKTGKEYNLQEILSGLLTELENSYIEIENKEWVHISSTYNHQLFRKNLVSKFLEKNIEFEGIIKGVNAHGQLMVENSDGKIVCYRHKEIELLY